ncbi:sugar diacid recognition domain-containing protein [Clostridium sp. YIM B02569]|uniref:CdaR family transcriptional regulator n=1 Tax=Clostridium sp. YIM B02569 TaxID=2911967 RepID=UPI001EEEE04F|nr:sugar diacid recognition domain-containing protein [Clostridium sp. YIM B02569]
MTLSKTIAQKIVLEMMNVIPYNINVMDESGIIIGSGDSKRIGNLHEGARKAIDNQQINEVFEEDDRMKPGVNEPIIINDKVIGVIGITGHPDEVRRFSKLVRVTAVLLIEQSKADEEIQNKRLNMQKFYNELTHRKTKYDESFHQRAKSYGIDLTKKCRVILVDGNINSRSFKILYQKYSSYSEVDDNRIAFFVTSKDLYNGLLENLKTNKDVKRISIGAMEDVAAISLESAELAMEFGAKIKSLSLVYSYDELRFFIKLSHDNKLPLISMMSNLDKAGNKLELIQTIQAYIEENGDIGNVANRLNIHRNTLNYRLEKIKKLTGKNPKNLLELFELLCGLIWR